MRGIPHDAHLRSFIITCGCASLDDLKALGEKWGSTLRYFQCIMHIQQGEIDSSMKRIDEFVSKFPHLVSLHCGYCRHRSTDAVSIQCFARIVGRLPKLVSFIIRTYVYPPDEAKYECDVVNTLVQVNRNLTSVGVRYEFRFPKNLIWKRATLSMLEFPNGMTGKPCIWTPDPFLQQRWIFWLKKFGSPSTTRRAMSERWPGSSIPSLHLLEKFAAAHVSMLDAHV